MTKWLYYALVLSFRTISVYFFHKLFDFVICFSFAEVQDFLNIRLYARYSKTGSLYIHEEVLASRNILAVAC